MPEPATPRAGHQPDADELAQLIDATGTLRRVLRARMRAAWPYDELPVGQLDLLRLLVETPGLSVNQAAQVLAVAPNSVSTMVRTMVDAGLLERRTDPGDARAARLYPSAAAGRRFRRWRKRRAQLLAVAATTLDDSDQRALRGSAGAMRRLAAALAEAAPGPGGGAAADR